MNFSRQFITIGLVLLLISTYLHANTYGPSTPEVAKFEPYDATNMVDLYTGDFIYTLPLLEIPGTGGSYPLAISYKAGIPTNDQASWVGLGWNLTPGYINRNVAGLPDDLLGGDVISVTKDRFSQSFGVAIGKVTVGGHYDNTQGFSGYAGASMQYAAKYGSVGLSVSFDNSGIGIRGSYSFGQGQIQVSSGISIATGGTGSTSSSEISSSMVPFSISSTNTNAYFSASGQAWIFRFSFGQQCGTYKVKSYGHLYADEMIEDADANTAWVGMQDSLQIKLMQNQSGFKLIGSFLTDYKRKTVEDMVFPNLFGLRDSDESELHSKLYQTEAVVQKNEEPAIKSWGNRMLTEFEKPHMFLSKDGYMVNAQGLNGAMTSHRNKRQILPRTDIFNRASKSGLIDMSPITYEYLHYNVRPDNPNMLHDDINDGTGVVNRHHFRFLGDAGGAYRNEASNSDVNYTGKKVYYYTDSASKCITGFSVTKEDGITYNFKRPLYNLVEVSVAQGVSEGSILDKANAAWGDFLNAGALWPVALYTKQKVSSLHDASVDFNISINANKYAYAWLITSVIGPDFVDMNNNGECDFGDLGYWVRFNYSENPDVDDYEWREPVYGTRPSSLYDPYTMSEKMDKGFACGKKQIYYVKSIETNTHIAEFELSDRKDAYACRYEPDPSNVNNSLLLFTSGVNRNAAKSVDPFGSGGSGLVNTGKPLKKLDRIKLHKRNLVTGIKYSATVKEIAFEYSYNLCKGTPNSDVNNDEVLGDVAKDGKLTLKEIHLKGTNGFQSIPPYIFSYNENSKIDNPYFSYDKWDRWGFYKSNGRQDHLRTNGNDVAAWSLRSVVTPMGAKLDVEYESDDYARVQNKISGDALKYEGDAVPIEYVKDGTDRLTGLVIPVEAVGTSFFRRLRVNDSIELSVDLAKIRFTQKDYTNFINTLQEKFATIKRKPMVRALGITSAMLDGIDCGAQCIATFGAVDCPQSLREWYCISCLSTGFGCATCQTSCVNECVSGCIDRTAECMRKIYNYADTAVQEKATILASVLGDYVDINYTGVVQDVVFLTNGKIRIMFAEPVPLTLKTDIGIPQHMSKLFDPIAFNAVYDCAPNGRKLIDIGDTLTGIFMNEVSEVLGEIGLYDGLRDIFGSQATNVFFPMTSALRSLIGNNGVHLTIRKIEPSDQTIRAQLSSGRSATMLDSNGFFVANSSRKYHNVKKGGGVRVKSLTLNNGLGSTQRWNYYYDFLGNGTGITTGVVPSEPLPCGPEGSDDRVFRQEEAGNFYMAAPFVGYEKVTVVDPNGSRVVNEFNTPWDYPYIAQRGGAGKRVHKYTDPSLMYGKIRKREYFSADANPLKVFSEEHTYEKTYNAKTLLDKNDTLAMGDTVAARTVSVRDEGNVARELPLGSVRTTYDNFLMKAHISDFTFPLPLSLINKTTVEAVYHNIYQYDVVSFPLVKITTATYGQAKEVHTKVWDKFSGQPLVTAERTSDGKWKITDITPAYHTTENSTMYTKNMLTQEYQNTTYEYRGNINQPVGAILASATPVQSVVQAWGSSASVHNWVANYYNAGKVYNPADNTWLTPTNAFPAQYYKTDTWNWRADANTANKSVVFSTGNNQWVKSLKVKKYDRFGQLLEAENAVGAVTTVIRGNGNEFVTGEIANADFKVSSVLTGDYDEGGSYLDRDDAWERGQEKASGCTAPGSALVCIDSSARHFGESGIIVRNAYGPSRNFKLQPNTDYILSCWMKVASGNVNLVKNTVIGVDYRRHNGTEVWPLNLYSASMVSTIGCSGVLNVKDGRNGWKYLELSVPATEDINSDKWSSGYQYARVWIGAPNGNGRGGDATVYIDDIRFYPNNAVVKTYYHNKALSKPIAFVDENNNAKYYNFEPMGRLVTTKNNAGDTLKQFAYSTGNIKVYSPEVNAVWPVTDTVTIKWGYWRTGVNLRFYLSNDGGATWPADTEYIATHLQLNAGSDSIRWNIPATINCGNNCKVKVVDIADNGTVAISDAFKIVKGGVLAPVSNTNISISSILKIKWVLLDVDSVDIYYLQGGTNHRSLVRNLRVPNAIGEYYWTVSNELDVDPDAVILVVGKDAFGNEVTGARIESEPFKIEGQSNFIRKWLIKFLGRQN
jgi:hypothetical protein